MTEQLKLLAADVVDTLAKDIDANLTRYRSGDFADLARHAGWEIRAQSASWDPSIVSRLDPAGTAEAEIRNSLLVYNGLTGMTPALAREERLWARLCHIECLEFARARWLKGDEKDVGRVRDHFFANGLAGCRDDNVIGRLWWNGHVAKLACPDDIELGLRRLLARANIRLQVIDRADTAFREPLIRGIVRLLGEEPWFDSYDAAIADFMFQVNKHSGGIVFEAMDDAEVDAHLEHCLALAMVRRQPAAAA